MNLDKLRRNITIDSTWVNDYLIKNIALKGYWVSGLNKILSSYDYDGVNYKYDINLDCVDVRETSYRGETIYKFGVWEKIKDVWYWSHVNTIETNYTGICAIINAYNQLVDVGRHDGKSFTHAYYVEDPRDMIDELLRFIDENLSHIFGFGVSTNLSRELVRITSRTWYGSKFSELNYLSQKKRELGDSYSFEMSKNRGHGDDINKGIDFVEYYGDEIHKSQHKQYSERKVHYDDEEDSVTIKDPIYKKKHRECTRLVLESNGVVYVFDISNIAVDDSIVVRDGQTTIPNDRLVEVFNIETDPLVYLLQEVFILVDNSEYCFYMFDSDEPFVILDKNQKKVMIGFNNLEIEPIQQELEGVIDYFT